MTGHPEDFTARSSQKDLHKRGFHSDIHKIFAIGAAQDRARIFWRGFRQIATRSSQRDLYKIMHAWTSYSHDLAGGKIKKKSYELEK